MPWRPTSRDARCTDSCSEPVPGRLRHPPRRHAGPGAAPGPPGVRRPGSDRYQHSTDSGPEERRDVSAQPEPVPKEEPRSAYGNPDTYTVWGKTYQVMPTAEGYHEEGLASWYGRKFHGYRTSSGEAFDMYRFTAAHRTLPLPTYARVTNLDNGKSLVVRVNDRAPSTPTGSSICPGPPPCAWASSRTAPAGCAWKRSPPPATRPQQERWPRAHGGARRGGQPAAVHRLP